MKNLDLRINRTNSKGITLVALVISIIVLLILATVTIQTLTGNNGLLTKEETAVQSNKDSQELEKIKLAVAAAQLAGEGTLTTTNLKNELRTNFNDNDINNNLKFVSDYWTYKGYKIENNGNVEKGLPKEYQQVEYIESSGKQYINTNFSPDQDTSIITKVNYTMIPDGNQSIFGARINVYSNHYGLTIGNTAGNRNFYSGYNNKSTDIGLGCKTNTEYIINKNKNILYINENKKLEDDYEYFSCSNKMYIFAMNNNNKVDFCSCLKLYYLNLYNNEEICYSFIPCYSITTVTDVDGIERPKDTVGLYDTVKGKFYTNQGTGDFIAGPDV